MALPPAHYRSIKERHEDCTRPPFAVSQETEEMSGVRLEDEHGELLGVLDPLDDGLQGWIIHGHEDMLTVMEEYERLLANFRMACQQFDEVLQFHINTLPPEVRDPMRGLQTRMWGLL